MVTPAFSNSTSPDRPSSQAGSIIPQTPNSASNRPRAPSAPEYYQSQILNNGAEQLARHHQSQHPSPLVFRNVESRNNLEVTHVPRIHRWRSRSQDDIAFPEVFQDTDPVVPGIPSPQRERLNVTFTRPLVREYPRPDDQAAIPNLNRLSLNINLRTAYANLPTAQRGEVDSSVVKMD